MRSVSSAFWERLQGDHIVLSELIELQTSNNQMFRWTSNNHPIVSSGNIYDPFPGKNVSGIEESTDLGVGVTDFTVANTGDILSKLVDAQQLEMAAVTISRVFPDTPDLGRLEIFRGEIGDYTYNRQQITGQARSQMQGANQNWPYYTYQDNCVWRFGGNGCGFNTNSVTITGSLVVGSSTRLTLRAVTGTLVNSFVPGKLEFGKLTITSGVNSGVVRSVFSNTGDIVSLSHVLPFSLETGGVTFAVYPGCRKRLLDDCRSRFNNTSSFLGFPWIPRQEQAF